MTKPRLAPSFRGALIKTRNGNANPPEPYLSASAISDVSRSPFCDRNIPADHTKATRPLSALRHTWRHL